MDPQEAARVHVRPRRRAHQVWQLWLRIPSAVYALVVLIYVCYFIGRWNGTVDPWHEDGSVRKAAGEAGAAALVAAILSLALSGWEVYTYVSKRREEPLSAGVVCLDVVVICVAVAGFCVLLLADWSSDSPSNAPQRPWESDQFLAAWLSMGLMIMHAIMSIAGCCGCCFGQTRSSKVPKPVATTRALPTVTTNDVADNEVESEVQPPPYYQQVELQETSHKGPPPEYPGPSNGQASNS